MDAAQVTLVQAFFGLDPFRIQAATRQLSRTLSQNPVKDFVFVESQRSKSDAVFKWL